MPGVGFMANPANGQRPEDGMLWASDNGCFSAGASFRVGRYITWLEETLAPWRDTCLFAPAPDVVGDAEATWRQSASVLPLIRALGYPAALVAQDGIEHMAHIEWDAFDVLFLGGSTEWKLSPAAAQLVGEAKAHGKWVHMGRVNSGRRLRYAAEIGCDSADGTALAHAPDRYVPQIRRWLADVKQQPSLWDTTVARQLGFSARPTNLPSKQRVSVAQACEAASHEIRDLMRRMAQLQRRIPMSDQAMWVELLMLTTDLSDQWSDWAEHAAYAYQDDQTRSETRVEVTA